MADRTCTWQVGDKPCGQPADDYEWEPGQYWCEHHVAVDRVGETCMCCPRVLERVEDASDWYLDNGGQLCPDHNPARSVAQHG
jgi:hypothetical protein